MVRQLAVAVNWFRPVVVVRRMPRRRETPPVAWMFQLVTSEQERGAASISERSDMAGEISPPLNANLFMVVIR